MKFIAYSSVILFSILGLIRHWHVVNISRKILGRPKRSFSQYFINDLDEKPSLLFIEPYKRNFKDQIANNLAYRINVITYVMYILIVIIALSGWQIKSQEVYGL
ncbi:hypothetical protein GCM10009122_37590 [Fulvivirga kasyanovii]|uniref:hypothetical protein n=1 Tax=Fulvivirga kasyanovii TaxID=396812 RepID=UPI0031D22F70